MNILFIDNFDSFTYNLVEEFQRLNCNVSVYRNNISIKKIETIINSFNPGLIVIGPGPSSPENAGICIPLIKKYFDKLPIFGICLGHQCIITAFDGKVGRCHEIIHGKPSQVVHNNENIFENIENPFQAGRYHSLTGLDIPECLDVTAKTNEVVMAIKHKSQPVFGLQFHPESILTPVGKVLINNILENIK